MATITFRDVEESDELLEIISRLHVAAERLDDYLGLDDMAAVIHHLRTVQQDLADCVTRIDDAARPYLAAV